nr:non-structural protein [Homalodisca vitripennis reovirus]ADN64684.1 non-structural protein [Homalodisca vitripennis reovirus]
MSSVQLPRSKRNTRNTSLPKTSVAQPTEKLAPDATRNTNASGGASITSITTGPVTTVTDKLFKPEFLTNNIRNGLFESDMPEMVENDGQGSGGVTPEPISNASSNGKSFSFCESHSEQSSIRDSVDTGRGNVQVHERDGSNYNANGVVGNDQYGSSILSDREFSSVTLSAMMGLSGVDCFIECMKMVVRVVNDRNELLNATNHITTMLAMSHSGMCATKITLHSFILAGLKHFFCALTKVLKCDKHKEGVLPTENYSYDKSNDVMTFNLRIFSFSTNEYSTIRILVKDDIFCSLKNEDVLLLLNCIGIDTHETR